MRGVEEQGGAGGELAVDEDEVAGAEVAVDGEGEVLGAEDGVEADQALCAASRTAVMAAAMRRLAAKVWLRSADEVGDGAEGEHGEGDGEERAAEEAHGGAVRSKRWPRERL